MEKKIGDCMKMHKKILLGSLLAVTALGLTACGSNSAGSSKSTLNWMESTELTSLDPSKASDYTSIDQLNNTYVGLYRLGNHAKAYKAIAAKTSQSPDGKTWTFNLRHDAKWSNGQAVTAKDFVYAWRRTVRPSTGAQYSYLYSGIKNADAITSGKQPASSLGIKALSKYKLQVQLDRRIPYFKLLLSFPAFAPQSQQAVKKYGSKYGTASKYQVYNGPFVHKGWTGANLSWHLQPNKYYFAKQKVHFKRVNFSVQKTATTAYNLYQSGKLDGSILNKQSVQSMQGESGYTDRPMADTQFIELNTKNNPALRNLKIRQALSMAINRKAITKTVGAANKPATTFSPTGLTTVNGKDYTKLVTDKDTAAVTTYQPKKANQLFKQGLQEIGRKKLNLTLISFDGDDAKHTAEAVQSQLEGNLSGLNVRVQSIPIKSALSRGENGKFDLLMDDWIADFADPISFLDLYTTANSNNYGKWDNARYNQLISASRNNQNSAERFDQLAQAEKILLKDVGTIPIYHANNAWMDRTSVKGIVYNSAGAAFDFQSAYKK